MFQLFQRILPSAVLLLMLTSAALANSGAAVVTHWRVAYEPSGRNYATAISVSNVSTRDIVVTLRLYDLEGDPIGSSGFLPVIVASGQLTGCNSTNNSCTLPAGTSGTFGVIGSGSVSVDTYGHGAIEWSSSGTDNNPVALVASGQVSYAATGATVTPVRTIIITRDQPF
jgi:hypothetical protein